MLRLFLAFGSNLGDSKGTVTSALAAIDAHPDIELEVASPWYRTPPLGPEGQADYVNGVASFHTTLNPFEILKFTQSIEADHGRTRNGPRWGSRTLDIDLLLIGGLRLISNRLTLPHPHLHQRAFVLIPLMDIAPQLEIPGYGCTAKLVEALPDNDKNAVVRLQ